jgi:hypothetical protein
MKTADGKARWRAFCETYKGRIHDYNFGTLLRTRVDGDYTPENTVFGARGTPCRTRRRLRLARAHRHRSAARSVLRDRGGAQQGRPQHAAHLRAASVAVQVTWAPGGAGRPRALVLGRGEGGTSRGGARVLRHRQGRLPCACPHAQAQVAVVAGHRAGAAAGTSRHRSPSPRAPPFLLLLLRLLRPPARADRTSAPPPAAALARPGIECQEHWPAFQRAGNSVRHLDVVVEAAERLPPRRHVQHADHTRDHLHLRTVPSRARTHTMSKHTRPLFAQCVAHVRRGGRGACGGGTKGVREHPVRLVVHTLPLLLQLGPQRHLLPPLHELRPRHPRVGPGNFRPPGLRPPSPSPVPSFPTTSWTPFSILSARPRPRRPPAHRGRRAGVHTGPGRRSGRGVTVHFG